MNDNDTNGLMVQRVLDASTEPLKSHSHKVRYNWTHQNKNKLRCR